MAKYEMYQTTPIPFARESWSWTESRKKPIEECGEPLVPMSLVPDRILARPQYYLEEIEGALPECFARKGTFEKLIEASDLLPPGYRFVIFDCWRSPKVQKSLFETLKESLRMENPSLSEEELDKRTLVYVALPSEDPTKPSPHSTGGAVDLSIADEQGFLIEMGTDFDETSERARTTYFEELVAQGKDLSPCEKEALKNRRLLYHVMIQVGFTNYTDEWWHYDYGNQNWAWVSGSDKAFYGKASPRFRWNQKLV